MTPAGFGRFPYIQKNPQFYSKRNFGKQQKTGLISNAIPKDQAKR
jgi:hypothetical protein